MASAHRRRSETEHNNRARDTYKTPDTLLWADHDITRSGADAIQRPIAVWVLTGWLLGYAAVGVVTGAAADEEAAALLVEALGVVGPAAAEVAARASRVYFKAILAAIVRQFA
ncbi:hypothetical protein BC938DRAFT_481541 [Jimgerdemannia flammicorona]|uniref:Uncharacterized protein n=1 Tax=Jimgerdemannia flammicorona TaxID=994334 RepID=A0A433QG31_9FUNG|nr:hypothetical protein BC938DRAFT_481541 [Jimgerdemannia flammicorona]